MSDSREAKVVVDEVAVKLTIARTASNKLERKLAVTSESTTAQAVMVIDRGVASFAYLENKLAREVEHDDVAAIDPPTEPDGPESIPEFGPVPTV